MKILVTGAAGFIGRNLCVLLEKKGNEVLATDMISAPFADDYFQWDIRHGSRQILEEHAKKIRSFGVEACVHLAAVAAPRQATADPVTAYATNVRGTQNVLAACMDAGVRKVVFASSAHVYGISPRYLPTDEQHPRSLLDTYTTTKILGEELLALYHQNHGLSTTVLRLFNGYGPGQSADYFLGVKLGQAQKRQPLTIMNGAVTKDWVHVSDICEAFRLAVSTKFVGPINIGTGIETSLEDCARHIAESVGLELVKDNGRDDSPTRMCCDWKRAKSVLGWNPTVKVLDGLSALIRELEA